MIVFEFKWSNFNSEVWCFYVAVCKVPPAAQQISFKDFPHGVYKCPSNKPISMVDFLAFIGDKKELFMFEVFLCTGGLSNDAIAVYRMLCMKNDWLHHLYKYLNAPFRPNK